MNKDYAEAYLLGAYLGDGDIAYFPRTRRMQISCDPKYPNIIEEIFACTQIVFPKNKVNIYLDGSVYRVTVYNQDITWVFPDKANENLFSLESWITDIIDKEPKAFLRGSIHTDGSRFIRRVYNKYEYLSYEFKNNNFSIIDLVCYAADLLNLDYKVTSRAKAMYICFQKRKTVAILDTFIGPKT